MRLDRVINYAHQLSRRAINENSIIIDATCGNGNDTLFLCNQISNGCVFAFDIQEQAILNTEKLLLENNQRDKVILIKDSHVNILNYVDEDSADLVMFNLGYLPGADKTLTTRSDTSIDAITNSLKTLKKNGLCVIVLYPGHEEGAIEANLVEAFISTLDFKYHQAVKYGFINNIKNPPYIIAIERVK
jgi:methylase of polypeptide subunit release factors